MFFDEKSDFGGGRFTATGPSMWAGLGRKNTVWCIGGLAFIFLNIFHWDWPFIFLNIFSWDGPFICPNVFFWHWSFIFLQIFSLVLVIYLSKYFFSGLVINLSKYFWMVLTIYLSEKNCDWPSMFLNIFYRAWPIAINLSKYFCFCCKEFFNCRANPTAEGSIEMSSASVGSGGAGEGGR